MARNRRKPKDQNHKQERQGIPVSDSYEKDLQKTKDHEQNSSREEEESEPKSDNLESGYTSPVTSPDDSMSSDSTRTEYEPLNQNELLKTCGIEFKHGSLVSPDLPKRPGFGTLGRKMKLISNFFPIAVPKGCVYHYDVDVTDVKRDTDDKIFCEEELNQNADEVIGENREVKRYRCFKTKEKRQIVQAMLDRDAIFKGLFAAYDGEKNLYTRKPLSTSFPHIFLTNEEDEIKGQVKIKPVKRKDTASCAIRLDIIQDYFNKITNAVPVEAIAALETIMRHGACLRLTPVGRSFFSPPGPRCLNPLGGGLEVWFGYHQSIVINQWNLSVNLDISATTFLPGGPLLKFVADLLDINVEYLRRKPFLSNGEINRINRRLKDRKIKTTHTGQGRKYTVFKLLSKSAHDLVLGEEVNGQTVAQYFRERYNKVLEFPNLPCLQVKPQKRNVYIPLEFCELVHGQHYNKELSKAQKNEMIKFTSTAPKERFNKISEKNNFDVDETVKAFNIQVSKDPMIVEARVLDPPSLMYGEEKKVRPRDGVWNMRDTKFSLAATIEPWVIISFVRTDKNNINEFCVRFGKIGRNLGVKIQKPQTVKFSSDGCNFEELLSNVKSYFKARLALVIVPDEIKNPLQSNSVNESIYRNVKKSAETTVGLITQVITEKTFLKIADPYNKAYAQLITNIFLKINSKMGGINYSLILSEIPPILWKPTIVIGADVNHPGAYRGFKHSLAACAGSLDARCSLYAVRTLPQLNMDPNKKSAEIITDLESMVRDILRAFYQHTQKQKPEKIIFYRDGVSEGEFQKIRNSEVVSVRKACLSINADYKPAVTFIVVQKRHHMRAMVKDSRDSKNLNPLAGTVMDKGIGHPENFDFYLNSHNCPKGTARSAHYTVIEDDSGFSADDIQKFTNQLCYTFVRCTKSISIPAPVQYAHLAAYRARQYLESGTDGSTTSCRASTGLYETTIEDVKESMEVFKDLKNRMYFV